VAAQDALAHLVARLLHLDKEVLAEAQVVAAVIIMVAAVAGHQRLELLVLIVLAPVEMELLLLLVVQALHMLAVVGVLLMGIPAHLQHVPLAVRAAAVKVAH
jgi:hypothetical protein